MARSAVNVLASPSRWRDRLRRRWRFQGLKLLLGGALWFLTDTVLLTWLSPALRDSALAHTAAVLLAIPVGLASLLMALLSLLVPADKADGCGQPELAWMRAWDGFPMPVCGIGLCLAAVALLCGQAGLGFALLTVPMMTSKLLWSAQNRDWRVALSSLGEVGFLAALRLDSFWLAAAVVPVDLLFSAMRIYPLHEHIRRKRTEEEYGQALRETFTRRFEAAEKRLKMAGRNRAERVAASRWLFALHTSYISRLCQAERWREADEALNDAAARGRIRRKVEPALRARIDVGLGRDELLLSRALLAPDMERTLWASLALAHARRGEREEALRCLALAPERLKEEDAIAAMRVWAALGDWSRVLAEGDRRLTGVCDADLLSLMADACAALGDASEAAWLNEQAIRERSYVRGKDKIE